MKLMAAMGAGWVLAGCASWEHARVDSWNAGPGTVRAFGVGLATNRVMLAQTTRVELPGVMMGVALEVLVIGTPVAPLQVELRRLVDGRPDDQPSALLAFGSVLPPPAQEAIPGEGEMRSLFIKFEEPRRLEQGEWVSIVVASDNPIDRPTTAYAWKDSGGDHDHYHRGAGFFRDDGEPWTAFAEPTDFLFKTLFARN